MNPNLFEAMFEINVAVVMVAVTVVIFVWFQRSEAAASARRMMRTMTRVGVDPGIATHGDRRTKVIIKEARRRCGRCPVEDVCDRWLAGKVEGGNTFCPNARTFRSLTGISGRTA
ncbi:MAG: DUF6455 family protein [Rhodospirillales bacterium]